MRILIASLCYLAVLFLVLQWTSSSSEWLLFGVIPVLLLDRHGFRLLPWTVPAAFPSGLFLRLSFLLVAVTILYVGLWGVTVREACYLGTGIGLMVFAVEFLGAGFRGLAARFHKEKEKPWVGRARVLMLWVLVLLLLIFISPLAAFHPVHTIPTGTPALLGLEFEDVVLRTSDGLELSAWLVPHPQPRGSLIFCHGHGGNRDQGVGLLPTFHEVGLNVLLFDFRAHGESPGHTLRFGRDEVRDVIAAEAYLRERYPDQPIFILAASYGAAVTLQALPELPNIRGVWLEGCFSRLGDVAENKFAWVSPGLRNGLIDVYSAIIWLDCHFWAPDIRPIDHLTQTAVPIFFCHGQADTFIPFAQAQEMYEAYRGPKWHYWVEGAGHDNMPVVAGKERLARMKAFFEGRLTEK